MTKATNASKRRRSAKAPVHKSGVMAANIPWKAAKRTPGMVGAFGRGTAQPTCERKACFMLPKKKLPEAEKQREKPTTNHSVVKSDRPAKHCMRTETEFLALSRPASKSPSAGIISKTAIVETNIQVVSALLIEDAPSPTDSGRSSAVTKCWSNVTPPMIAAVIGRPRKRPSFALVSFDVGGRASF